MTIYVDADGCPVVDLTLSVARAKGIPVVILCDTAHQIQREGAVHRPPRGGQRGSGFG